MTLSTSHHLTYLCVTLLLILAGCAGENTPPNITKPTPEPSLEFKLAAIDSGGLVEESDIRINRFRYLMDEISERTGDSKLEIADQTVKYTQVARNKYGKDIKNLDLMEAAHKYYVNFPKAKSNYETVASFMLAAMIQ
jgi:starvation-inducible outer membrane lipoprotein